MSRSFAENLELYARLTVRVGVNIQPGQELIVTVDVADTELTRLIVAEAYRAGAKNVQVMYSDDQNGLARYMFGSDEAISYAPQWLYDGMECAHRNNAARLAIFGGDPALLKDVDPSKVATYSRAQGAAAMKLSSLISGFDINWCGIGAASPAWAKLVFPDLSEADAMEKLWDAIFQTSHVNEPDPVGAWVAHLDHIAHRVDWLNDLGIDALRFRGPGTDLKVGLADGSKWIGGWGEAKNGVRCSPNIPTEEAFTMPHRERVEGHVSSTKPLSVRGQVVERIRVDFHDGKAVTASASRGEDTLHRLLDTDEGARRLGEVALVPHSSAVSRTGMLFYNTLYDENAACHIAMGRSYDENLPGCDLMTDEEKRTRGANESIIHVDWMIGSGEIDVDGMRADGSSVPVLRAGEWA